MLPETEKKINEIEKEINNGSILHKLSQKNIEIKIHSNSILDNKTRTNQF